MYVETEKLGKGKRPIDVSTSPRLLRQAEAACEAAHATAEAGCHPTIAFAIAATRRAAHGHVYYMWDSVWRVSVAVTTAIRPAALCRVTPQPARPDADVPYSLL